LNYLLDTYFLSELYRSQPNPGVVNWVSGTDENRLYIASLSLGEIQKGIAKLADGVKRRQIQNWLDQDLKLRFRGRILMLDMEIALEWGTLLGHAERNGTSLPVIDAMIAATAVVHNQMLVTRNIRDFERLPVRIVNPWEW